MRISVPTGGVNIGCRLTHSVNQSIPAGVWTLIAFDTELEDTDAMHDPAQNTRITIQHDGVYLLTAAVAMTAHADTGYRKLLFEPNGAGELESVIDRSANDGTGMRMVLVARRRFVKGDYVRLYIFSNAGAAVDVEAIVESTPIFAAQKVG